jgi:hypothetical protein
MRGARDMAESPKFKIVDNPTVSEVYANKLVAAFFDGGALVITLGATRFTPGDSGEKPKDGAVPPVHVTARLAISPAGAVELTNALNNMLSSLRQMQQKGAAAADPKANLA